MVIPNIRWVERYNDVYGILTKVRVLQVFQPFNVDVYVPGNPGGSAGQWIDVPTVEQ